MKKLIISLLVVTAFVVAPVSMFAQAPTSVTGTAKASIVSSLAVSNTTSGGATGDAAYLDFGSVTKTGAGTVIISNTGAASVTGGVALVASSSHNAAAFTVTGTSGAGFTVTIPTVDIELSGTTASNKIQVTGLNSSITNNGIIGGTGATTFLVGGTLNVGATQPDDTYSGTFAVNVNYN